jgi:hypothetical protein
LQPLTNWRAKDRDCQARNSARHYSYLHPREPKTGILRVEVQQDTAATHILKNQGQNCQQARNVARHCNHSLAGESRTEIVSRLEMWHGTAATYMLESRSEIVSRLQIWKGTAATHKLEPRTGVVSKLETQQGYNHSQTGKPRTGIVTRLETLQSTATPTNWGESRTEIVSRL